MKSTFLFLMLLISYLCFGIIRYVNINGSADYVSVQSAINASANSDTVLVYPGIYIENLDTNNKSITLSSLYLLNPLESYKHETILDGNYTSSVIYIHQGENVRIVGFTIRHGIGRSLFGDLSGGGILIRNNSEMDLSECIITANHDGGGLYADNAIVNLKGNSIHDNSDHRITGGMFVNGNSQIFFDPIELNSIYMNYAPIGYDFGRSPIAPHVNLVLDTLTVMNPDQYYIYGIDSVSVSVQHSVITPIVSDLYVSPSGNNENTGVSPAFPLKTISYALRKIISDSTQVHTIHLSEGLYSRSSNGDYFPLGIKENVYIEGTDSSSTILDMENQSCGVWKGLHPILNDSGISNLTIKNGNDLLFGGGIYIYRFGNYYVNNVCLENNYGNNANAAIQTIYGSIFLDNVKFISNHGGPVLHIDEPLDVKISNCRFISNTNNPANEDATGGGACITNVYTSDLKVEIVNSLFSQNQAMPDSWAPRPSSLWLDGLPDVKIVNCTFGDNSASGTTATTIDMTNSKVKMFNSIMYWNSPNNVRLSTTTDSAYPSELTINNSLIENGVGSITTSGISVVNWQAGNLASDPLWMTSASIPYLLLESSPCINTGTTDIEGFVFPGNDLAGNPRIVGNSIDMGCYEWDGVGIDEEVIPPEVGVTQLYNYPNPFNPSTIIAFNIRKASQVNLTVYNIKGQVVKSLVNKLHAVGNHSVSWDGKDANGKACASGVYYYRLNTNDKSVTKKMLLLK